MGRGRGRRRGKKESKTIDDSTNGEDEKLPTRQRGRPQKQVNNGVEEEDEFEKIEDDAKSLVFSKLAKNQAATENGNKRKVNESMESFKEENDNGTETYGADSIKYVGSRELGSRRKNKPRRAAEVGVECV
ncbi:protein pxr1-like [Dorcoceras hygrometricum]|uniref:Protein pxr1-like n=1 Tax=Dorcoceras hygrometricum TaxID=472368 RepID=A0A2Z7CCP1_9LAMI|nr:protein pxr1-like [Dorcoceras hygrometricum]